MGKSTNAKQKALDRKQYEQKHRKKDSTRGRDGCARLKALHQPEPEGDSKQSFLAKLRFWE